jgi:hypothetical protein
MQLGAEEHGAPFRIPNSVARLRSADPPRLDALRIAGQWNCVLLKK